MTPARVLTALWRIVVLALLSVNIWMQARVQVSIQKQDTGKQRRENFQEMAHRKLEHQEIKRAIEETKREVEMVASYCAATWRVARPRRSRRRRQRRGGKKSERKVRLRALDLHETLTSNLSHGRRMRGPTELSDGPRH